MIDNNDVDISANNMEKINFYEIKYEALEEFYGWVDRGSNYNIAVDQVFYYHGEMSEIEEIIYYITIATRFERSAKSISDEFKKKLETIISKANIINLKDYGLTDDEIEIFDEELHEVQLLLQFGLS